MGERLSSHELVEWEIYSQHEPFGEERADLRAGIIAAVIANTNRGKDQKAFSPTDFMPYNKSENAADPDIEAKNNLLALQQRYARLKGAR